MVPGAPRGSIFLLRTLALTPVRRGCCAACAFGHVVRRSGLYPDADVEDFPHTAAQYRGAGADFRCRAGGGIRPRGIPVDYNTKEQRFNWELLFCELYAGGKYNNDADESYEYSLGLNGLGLCSTQYASEYMDVDIRRDGVQYLLHFEKGENVRKIKKEIQ